jgi:hypothetical protein
VTFAIQRIELENGGKHGNENLPEISRDLAAFLRFPAGMTDVYSAETISR